MCDISSKNRFHIYVWLTLAAAIVISGAGIGVDLLASGTQSGPDLKVKAANFYPQGDVERQVNITVKFTRDMVPADSLDKAVLAPPIEFEPPIPGLARWIEKDVLRFYPDEVLRPATRYKARIKSDKKFLYGNRISDDRTFEFRTPPLELTRSWLGFKSLEGDPPDYTRALFNLSFNYPIDVDQLVKKTKITGEKNAAVSKPSFEISEYRELTTLTMPDGKIRKYAKGFIIKTEPIKLGKSQQIYRLTIDPGLGCPDCGESLLDRIEKTVKIQAIERLYVTEAVPITRGNEVSIMVNFSTAIQKEDIENYITIKPDVNYSVNSNYSRINLHGDFKPGKTYEVTVKEGLPGAKGMVLEDEFSSKITMRDLPPSVKFVSRGVYLPRDGARLLSMETINVEEVSVEIDQIFSNNILSAMHATGYYSDRYNFDLSKVGRKFFEKTKPLRLQDNEPLTTTIDIGGIIGDTAKGIFKIYARNKKGRWTQDSRLVMLTDLGISARLSDDYLMIWVNSLSEASPVSKATVQLLSKNNQILLSGKTDSRGIAVFKNVGDKLEGFEPFLITVSHKDDLAFLKFAECLLPTSDFEIKGRPYLTSGYDAFIYTDRGIYRPGEMAHLSCIVRGAEGSIPPEFPYFITIYEPGAKEFRKFRLKNEGTGFLTVDLNIPDFAKTGNYRIKAHIGEDMEIGRAQFAVEEFMPDRIRVDVRTEKDFYYTGDTMQIEVNGKYFFGAPAAGHKVSGRMNIDAFEYKSPKHSQYIFNDPDRQFSTIKLRLPDSNLDDSGFYSYQQAVSPELKPPSALRATISASVSEPGGRAVNGFTSVMIHPYRTYIGMRPQFEGYVKSGESCRMDLIALSSDGEAAAIDTVTAYLYHVVYNTVLKQDSFGKYRYISEQTLELTDSVQTPLPAEGTSVTFSPPDYGRYRIIAVDPDGGHQASFSFYVSGWGYAPWSMENPDRIDIDLDKTVYSSGEDATVQVRAPFGGRLLLTVEKDNVIDFITYEMEENTAEFILPIKKDYFPNAYITATVIKKAGDVDKTSPARAFGVVPVMLEKKEKELAIKLNAPEVMEPKNSAVINIEVGTPGTTELTVAAVDAGILRLIDYKTPEPLEYYYGKRMLHLRPYDIYSYIYPEIERAESHLSPGGGLSEIMAPDLMASAEMEERSRRLNPFKSRRVKPVALWSGIVETDADGKATVEFDIPEFNGKLVVMAVAVHEDKFGSATGEIIVRDKIVIQESFPRFVSPGDSFDGLIMLFNNTGETSEIAVDLEFDGPLEIVSDASQRITLDDNTEGTVIFKLKAMQRPGTISCRIAASDDEARSEINFEMPNRPGMPLEIKYGSGSVRAGDSVQFNIPGEWIATTDRYVVQTSSFAAAQFQKDIDFLVRYPYGCLEQTTSRLFPLLYFDDLARFVQPEQFGSGGPDYFIQEGIMKLSGMMLNDGRFSFWPGGRYDYNYASIYGSHFLVEANKAGYHVDKKVFENMIDALVDIARGKTIGDYIGEPERIYAAYVLARAGKMQNRIINYIKDIYTADLRPYSRYQLAGALALSGDSETALTILPADIQPAYYEPETGGRFDSGVRSNAILLEVLNDIDPGNPSCAVLAKSLMDDSRIGRWYTTQATAYALMSLGKYLRGQDISDFTGEVDIANDSTYSISTDDFKIIRDDLGGKPVTMSIDGSGVCYYYWQAGGVPSESAPAEYNRGISITREYLDVDGKTLDINVVPLGEQVVCHISARAVDSRLENVVISDLIPAGFEIENLRITTTPKLSWTKEKSHGRYDYLDIRDDRMLLFATLETKNSLDYYYTLRAISAGKFAIPPIAAECMYNPLVAGASSSGVMIIKNGE